MFLLDKLIKNGFKIIIIVFALYVSLVLLSDIPKLSTIKIEYELIPIIIIPMTLHLLLLGVRFHRFVISLGIPISLKKNIIIYLSGLSLNATPAGIGQIIRSNTIKKESGYAISKTAPILLAEKWGELVSVVIILIFLEIIEDAVEFRIIIIIGIIFSSLLAILMKNRVIFIFFKGIIKKTRYFNALEDNLLDSHNSFRVLMKPRIILDGLMLSTPAKILEGIAAFTAFKSLGIDLGYVRLTEIFFTSIISGVISFVPGGFFITEGSMLGLLLKYGIGFSLASIGVVFVRLTTIWYATFLGIIMNRFIIKN